MGGFNPRGCKGYYQETLRREKQGNRPLRVLVVQVEVGADGKTTYGIIGGGDIRAAAAEELVGITPIVEKKRGRYTDSGR